MVLRVAYTIEQCWHRVPGGTASSALGTARALAVRPDLDVYGVSAWHRRLPPPPWTPPMRLRRGAPLPRPLLYEAWHRLRQPRVPGRPDVIHATGMAIPPKSAPLVVTVHDLAFLSRAGLGTAHGQRFFERSWDLTLRHADVVLTPSEATKRDCVAHGFDAARVRVVPWGVEPPAASAVDVRARFGLGERFILAVGTIEPRKNLPSLLQAFERLDDRSVQLVIAGPDGWNESLAPHIVNGRDRVRLLGFVPEVELSALYAAAAVFCYPSRQEGFGIPVLEAMAHGAPVVTSRGTATEEVVGEAGIVIDPDAVDEITVALDRVLADPALGARLGTAARARAATFTWARTAELTAAAYHAVTK